MNKEPSKKTGNDMRRTSLDGISILQQNRNEFDTFRKKFGYLKCAAEFGNPILRQEKRYAEIRDRVREEHLAREQKENDKNISLDHLVVKRDTLQSKLNSARSDSVLQRAHQKQNQQIDIQKSLRRQITQLELQNSASNENNPQSNLTPRKASSIQKMLTMLFIFKDKTQTFFNQPSKRREPYPRSKK